MALSHVVNINKKGCEIAMKVSYQLSLTLIYRKYLQFKYFGLIHRFCSRFL